MKTKVADWLNRSDLSSVLGDFVNMAIKRVERECNLNYMITSATGTLSTDLIALPTTYKETNALILTTSGVDYYLKKDSYPHLISVFNTESATERPRSFATIPAGTSVMLRPYPDSTTVYTYELIYYLYSAEMTSDSETHWLMTNAWEIVLYGAMLEAAMYIVDSDRLATVELKYNQFKQLLVDSERDEEFTGYQTAKTGYMGG